MKICDLIRDAPPDEKLISFEFFVPRKQESIESMVAKVAQMVAKHRPLYIDLTWRGPASELALHLDVTKRIREACGNSVEVMLHIAVSQMTKDEARNCLQAAHDNGIENILALRGDPANRDNANFVPHPGGFSSSVELIRFIRAEFGSFFCIGASCYPEGHQTSQHDLQAELDFCVEKVRAGADLLVTQGCYVAQRYADFISELKQRCNAPIIPGVLMFKSSRSFSAMARLCDITIPQEWTKPIEDLVKNEDKTNQDVLEAGWQMTRELVESLRALGMNKLHLFTMNDEKCVNWVLGQ